MLHWDCKSDTIVVQLKSSRNYLEMGGGGEKELGVYLCQDCSVLWVPFIKCTLQVNWWSLFLPGLRVFSLEMNEIRISGLLFPSYPMRKCTVVTEEFLLWSKKTEMNIKYWITVCRSLKWLYPAMFFSNFQFWWQDKFSWLVVLFIGYNSLSLTVAWL